MFVKEINTENRAEVKEYLQIPFRIYRQTPEWVPPIRSEVRAVLNRRKHPFYIHSNAAFFIAWRDGKAVGRIAALNKIIVFWIMGLIKSQPF